MRGLQDSVQLVAGGGSGIGAATARRLASHGAYVAVGDIVTTNAEAVAAQIEAEGGRAVALSYDQSDEDSIRSLVAAAVDFLGRLDGLVCNAADLRPEVLGEDRNLLRMQRDVWMRTLEVNLVGNATLVAEALPHLLDGGGGAVVLTSSAVSATGEATRPAYAASKAGVNALVRHVASRWGKEGVRANAVSPGLVLSESARNLASERFVEHGLRDIRSPRLGEPEDIAGVIAFLLSDEGSWITGQVWGVDGGLVLRD